MLEILWYEPLDRQGIVVHEGEFSKWKRDRWTRDWSVVVTGEYLFTGRESCTWRDLAKYEYFILTWLGLHLNAGWYRRLTRPGQQAHRILTNALQRKKKRVSNVFLWIFLFSRTRKFRGKPRWEFTRRKSFIRKGNLCEKKAALGCYCRFKLRKRHENGRQGEA